MFPFIDACHCTLMSIAVREDAEVFGNKFLSKTTPLSCWLATLIMCFAGNIISSSLLGESLLYPLHDVSGILLATGCWYMVNFSPYDVVYRLCSILPIRVGICLLKEIQRTFKIHVGILSASQKYEKAFLVWIVVGMMRGSGSSFMRSLISVLFHSPHRSTETKLKIPTTSKSALAVSILFAFQFYNNDSKVSEKVYMIGLIFLMYFRLSILLFNVNDPFVLLENISSAILFGNTADLLQSIHILKTNLFNGNEYDEKKKDSPGNAKTNFHDHKDQ